MQRLYTLLGLVIVLAIAGCSATQAVLDEEAVAFPTPTSHPWTKLNTPSPMVTTDVSAFLFQPTATPTANPYATMPPPPTLTPLIPATPTASPTPRPTEPATPPPTPAPTTEVAAETFDHVTIYDDDLNQNWTILRNRGMDYNLEHAFQAHSGDVALAMKPRRDFSTMYFIVKNDANTIYHRDDVLGFSFWLYSGDDYVELDDLIVTIVGSNAYPYWVQEDDSVTNQYDPIFSETRLYYLGLNDVIPPETWVQVFVWLDDLLFDPIYDYVTGFYIKNDAGFFRTVLIDELVMYLLPETDGP